MLTKVQKWGNSLALRIPKTFAADAEMGPGSVVDISRERGGLMIRPDRPKKYVLADLLSRITKRNLHGEVDTGGAVGREGW